ncbi:plasmid pRiA4b ORF-3 family protein [Actinoplanes sp. NPDC026670]|uniref:plasmid pRiA4b ORF-3 family protein n=1 Tax=Actinoplanes sp. NPDC026670 TaxID=3154700 RepID=UPI0033D930F7
MSRGSRRPAKRNTSRAGRRPALAVVSDVDQVCDCPDCTGEGPGLEQMLSDLVDEAIDLVEVTDPLDAEVAGAVFVAMGRSGDDGTAALIEGVIPTIEKRDTRAALALLTAIEAVAGDRSGPVTESARAAAARLRDAGVVPPAWAAEVTEPWTAGPFSRLHDARDGMAVLTGVFERAGRSHALVIAVDHQDCGAAEEIYVLDGAELPAAIRGIQQSARADGVHLKTSKLGAPEFRWYAEQALEARAVHDEEDGPDPDGEDGPDYPSLAVLTENRLATLPPARRPRGAVASGHGDDRTPMEMFQEFAAMTGAFGGRVPPPPKLPVKRKKSNGPAPAYQIKVSLRGARPPIWRRLLVPGDITLNRLHQAILAAFGWHGGHMHVFDTDYGQFGRADRELGHRSDGPVTLEQVAPEVKDRLAYTYDFGDNWEHEIVVEKTGPAEPGAAYPVCTGGRRAAPPDDCGGMWGYQELIEVLADPRHPEHTDRLEWLGLDDAGQFAPDSFDLGQVNQRLRAR